MAVKKGGLGRGLDSLFADTGSVVVSGQSEGTSLALIEIEPDKDQPRKAFDEESLSELSKSIEEHGVLQPILVRPQANGAYKIVAGERRWRAARQAGLSEIPVIIKEISDAEAMEIALIENLQREDLDPVEEALGYRQLMERCNYTQEKAAKKLSKSRSAIANSLRLLALPDNILELLKSGILSAGHAKAILSLEGEARQREAANIICADKLNVRQAEALTKKMQKSNKAAPVKQSRPSIAAEVEISLREALGTEIKVVYREGKGSLNIGFYSDEQLKDFANLLGKYKK